MPILSTARQTLARVETLLGNLSNPRDRKMLTQWRDHWRGEVSGDLDAAMAVVPEDSFLVLRGCLMAEPIEIRGRQAHRGAYQGMLDVGLNPGGTYHDEIFAFGDQAMMLEATYSNIMYGRMLESLGDFDADALYLFHAPVTMVCPFSSDGRMLGKRDIIAAPISIEPTDRETLARLTAL